MEGNQKIISFLKTKPEGATLTEIASKTGHGRATVGKYLELLKAEDKADFKRIGRAKLWYLEQQKRPKILIVDDEPGVVKLLKLTLETEGYEILEAYNGTEALEIVNESMPDLIILDLMMPGLNGQEVCRILKENVLTRKIPVIMLTAKDELKSRVEGIRTGADDYVSKNFDLIDFKQRVRTFLQKPGERNKITNLPNPQIMKKKVKDYEKGISISFENLEKNYRNKEEFLKIASQLLTHSTAQLNNKFIGHIKDDQFLVLCRNEDTASLSKAIGNSFEEIMPYLDKKEHIRPAVAVLDKNQIVELFS